jgi:hypothetical protein
MALEKAVVYDADFKSYVWRFNRQSVTRRDIEYRRNSLPEFIKSMEYSITAAERRDPSRILLFFGETTVMVYLDFLEDPDYWSNARNRARLSNGLSALSAFFAIFKNYYELIPEEFFAYLLARRMKRQLTPADMKDFKKWTAELF